MADPNNVDPKDIDRLLAEIDAMNKPRPAAAPVPASPTGKAVAGPAPEPKSPDDRLQWTGIAAAGGAVVGFVSGAVLPFIGGTSTGIGAALGAAVVAFISGPPSWLGKNRNQGK